MRYTFTFGTRRDAEALAKRLDKRKMASNLKRVSGHEYTVSGQTDEPAVEIETIGFGLRVRAFSTEED